MNTTIILTTRTGFSIKKSFECLLRQTVLPNTVIIVDDGSMWLDAADIIGYNPADIIGQRTYIIKDHAIDTMVVRAPSNLANRYNVAMNMTHQKTDVWGFLKAGDIFVDNKIQRAHEVFNLDQAIMAVVCDSDTRMYNAYSGHYLNIRKDYDYCFMVKKDAFNLTNALFDIESGDDAWWNMLKKISTIGLIYHIPETLHETI